MTDRVIANLDAQADEEAMLIQSADDITIEATVQVIKDTNVLGALPPRKSRFNNTLFARDTKELPGCTHPSGSGSSTKEVKPKKNMFDV